MWGWTPVPKLWQDLNYAWRTLWKAPAFTLAAVLTLGLGIGANTAIFSVVNAVVLRPLKAPDAERLVRFITTTGSTSSSVSGVQSFAAWREQTTVLEHVSAHRLEHVNLTSGVEPEQVPVARVSAEFFRLFQPALVTGRTFSASEDMKGGPAVAVLSHRLWTRQFQGDPNMVGRPVLLGNVPHVVIGIVGAGFDTEQFDPLPDIWVPFQLDLQRIDGGNLFTVTGRLTPGTTLSAANAQLAVAATALRATPGSTPTLWTVASLHEAMVGNVRPSLNLLLIAVGVLLLIACVNVANLLLVRSDLRTREIAIRTALGAGRVRVIRQLLTESLLLAAVAGVFGLMIGMIGVRMLLLLYPGNNPFHLGDAQAIPRIGAGAAVTLDWRVLSFTMAASVATGTIFGLVPALHASRVDLVATMKRVVGARGVRHARFRGALVVIEVALALMLLVGSALLIRTSMALRVVDSGFDSSNVVTMRTSVSATRFDTQQGITELTREAAAKIRAVPGVIAATATCCMPLETVWQLPFVVPGRPPSTLVRRGNLEFTGFAGWTFVAPDYFDVLKIPIIRGRDFTDGDVAGAPGVVIINQEMARRYWPTGDPLNDQLVVGRGMRREYDTDPVRQIVGIVGDVRDTGLTRAARPAMYVPIAQQADGVTALNLRLLPLVWMARTATPALSAAAPIEKVLVQTSGLPVTRIRSMDQVVSESTARSRFDMWLMVVFGSCALLLSAIGVYGLMAYSVQQRTAEIGIRMALGADVRQVRGMVLRQGMTLTLCGVAAGLVASVWFARALSGLLFGVTSRDPLVFAAVTILLTGVAFVAVWLPAQRATRLNPVAALQEE